MNDEIVLTGDQVIAIRAMIDEYRNGEDPDKAHRLILMLEYLLSFWR